MSQDYELGEWGKLFIPSWNNFASDSSYSVSRSSSSSSGTAAKQLVEGKNIGAELGPVITITALVD